MDYTIKHKDGSTTVLTNSVFQEIQLGQIIFTSAETDQHGIPTSVDAHSLDEIDSITNPLSADAAAEDEANAS